MSEQAINPTAHYVGELLNPFMAHEPCWAEAVPLQEAIKQNGLHQLDLFTVGLPEAPPLVFMVVNAGSHIGKDGALITRSKSFTQMARVVPLSTHETVAQFFSKYSAPRPDVEVITNADIESKSQYNPELDDRLFALHDALPYLRYGDGELTLIEGGDLSHVNASRVLRSLPVEHAQVHRIATVKPVELGRRHEILEFIEKAAQDKAELVALRFKNNLGPFSLLASAAGGLVAGMQSGRLEIGVLAGLVAASVTGTTTVLMAGNKGAEENTNFAQERDGLKTSYSDDLRRLILKGIQGRIADVTKTPLSSLELGRLLV